jgi:PAS domain-containing protein
MSATEHELMDRILEPLSNQWQIALLALIVVMGALVWRAQRQVTRLAKTSGAMQEALTRLEEATGEITKRSAKAEQSMMKTEESVMKTEQTLKANLDEYRMALGSTNAYREYLQNMGLAPASDVEPILEAIPDGAEAVSTDGRVLYANKAFAELTSVRPGATIEEIAFRCRVRTFGGAQLEPDDLPESRVLKGEVLSSLLIRMLPPGRDHDVILSVNGQPARDSSGRVVAAVMLCRAVSEEVGMAIEVRRIAEERPETAPGVV